jgi:hypothetical protein
MTNSSHTTAANSNSWSSYNSKSKVNRWENNIPEEFFVSNEIALSDRIDKLFQYLNDNNCIIKDEGRVREFLVVNPNLSVYLWQALIQIWKKFGRGKRVILDLIFEDKKFISQGELFFNIKTDKNIDEEYEKMRQLENDWFLKINNNDIKYLNINLGF